MIIIDFPYKTRTASAAETESVGASLAETLRKSGRLSSFIALYGELGVGKTAFVRGFVSVLSPCARVISPTYAIVNEYTGGDIPVYHFDMYRITGDDDLCSTGFYDYEGKGVILAEWCENIPFALPDEYTRVKIEKAGSDFSLRDITVERCIKK